MMTGMQQVNQHMKSTAIPNQENKAAVGFGGSAGNMADYLVLKPSQERLIIIKFKIVMSSVIHCHVL